MDCVRHRSTRLSGSSATRSKEEGNNVCLSFTVMDPNTLARSLQYVGCRGLLKVDDDIILCSQQVASQNEVSIQVHTHRAEDGNSSLHNVPANMPKSVHPA